jgi:hypothetical protein
MDLSGDDLVDFGFDLLQVTHLDLSFNLLIELFHKFCDVLGNAFQVQALRDSDIVIAHGKSSRTDRRIVYRSDSRRKNDATWLPKIV